jgi:hypothetical protein
MDENNGNILMGIRFPSTYLQGWRMHDGKNVYNGQT